MALLTVGYATVGCSRAEQGAEGPGGVATILRLCFWSRFLRQPGYAAHSRLLTAGICTIYMRIRIHTKTHRGASVRMYAFFSTTSR